MGVFYEIYLHKISRIEFIPAKQNLLNIKQGATLGYTTQYIGKVLLFQPYLYYHMVCLVCLAGELVITVILCAVLVFLWLLLLISTQKQYTVSFDFHMWI